MRKTIELKIPAPCHEDWRNMTPNEQGRFCASCQKSVVDFSDMSDEELLLYFKNRTTQTCGRFRNDQLNKEMLFEQPKKINWFKYFLQLCIPTLLVACDEKSHGKVKLSSLSRREALSKNYRNTAFQMNQSTEMYMSEETATFGFVVPITQDPIMQVRVPIYNDSSLADDVMGTPVVSVDTVVTIVDTAIVLLEVPQEEIVPDTSKPLESLDKPGDSMNLVNQECNTTLGEIVTTAYVRPNVLGRIKKLVVDSIKTLSKKPSIEFRTYPNPLPHGSNLNIELSVPAKGQYTVSILDINGTRLQSESFKLENSPMRKQIRINEFLVSGQYIVQLMSPDGKMLGSQKLVVVK